MMMDVTTMSAGMIVAMGIYRPAIFIFALFGIAAIAALSASAVAQNPQAPINTLTDLEAALLACWVPPPMEQSRPGMQIRVLMSFKRNGELFEQPRNVFQSSEASDIHRLLEPLVSAVWFESCCSSSTIASTTALLPASIGCLRLIREPSVLSESATR